MDDINMNQQFKENREKVQTKWFHLERKRENQKKGRKEFENKKGKTRNKSMICINFITDARLGIL